MGDYNVNAVDDTMFKKVLQAANREQGTTEIRNAAFYTEIPAYTTLGSHVDGNAILVRAKGMLNSQTPGENPSSLVFSGDDYQPGDADAQGVLESRMNSTYTGVTGGYSKRFLTDLVGIDWPKGPVWVHDKFNRQYAETCKKTYSSLVANSSDYIATDTTAKEGEIAFVRLLGNGIYTKWMQCSSVTEGDEFVECTYLAAKEESGYEALADKLATAQAALNELAAFDNGYFHLLLDISKAPKTPKSIVNNAALASFLQALQNLTGNTVVHKSAYLAATLDAYSWTGVAYVKNGHQWINVAKYLLTKIGKLKPQTATSSDSVFRQNTYDIEKIRFADAYWDVTNKMDTRRIIQKQIHGSEVESMKTWNVMVGDCFFMIPPTSIRCVTQTTTERMPSMRARGSMTKSSGRSERILEMDIYFAGLSQINGIPYPVQLPNGETTTYFINGIRAMVSQFRLTPYLPIDNSYINETLGIDAVTLDNISMQTVGGFPNMMQVTVSMREFNYRVYMPELPAYMPEVDGNTYRNYFSSSINWDTFRWYTQQPLLLGESIKNLSKSSNEYATKAIGGRTAMIPVSGNPSGISFRIAKESKLKDMLETKLTSLRKGEGGQTTVLSDTEKDVCRDLTSFYTSIQSASAGGINENIAALNAKINTEIQSQGCFSLCQNNVLPMQSSLYGALKEANEISGDKLVNKWENVITNYADATGYWVYVGVKVPIDFPAASNKQAYKKLLISASAATKFKKDDFLKDDSITLCVKACFTNERMVELVKPFALDIDTADFQLIKYCASNPNEAKELTEVQLAQMRMEMAESIEFEDYPLPEIVVDSLSVSCSNTFTDICTTGTDGNAPQFMGGQDYSINASLVVTSESHVGLLNALPKISAYYAREYKLVLPSWPVRVKNELLQMLGINDVMLETVSSSTVPNQPGVFKVSLRMTTMDRMARNKEALKRISANDDGVRHGTERANINLKSYFEVNSILSKAELYPDLELPTIKELESKGIQFLRYKFDSDRTFVDPDFYYLYFQPLTSSIFRETAANFCGKGLAKTMFTDEISEDKITITPEKGNVMKKERNDKAQARYDVWSELAEKKTECQSEESELKKRERDKNAAKNALKLSLLEGSWRVSSRIRPSFMERRMADQLLLQEQKDAGVPALAKENKEPGGEWIKGAMSGAREAMEMIWELLNDPITERSMEQVAGIMAGSSNYDFLFKDTKYKQIFDKLGVDTSSTKFIETSGNILYAVSCAFTGKQEFKTKTNFSWKPEPELYGICLGSVQDKGSSRRSEDKDDIVKNGIEFGAFGIRMFDYDEISSLTGEAIDKKNPDPSNPVNSSYYTIDPYYRNAEDSVLNRYKELCILDASYCVEAHLRNALYWLYKLIDNKVFPSVMLDTLRAQAIRELKVLETSKKAQDSTFSSGGMHQEHVDQEQLKKDTDNAGKEREELAAHIKFLTENADAIDAGKIFTICALAMTNGDSTLLKMVKEKKYEELNGFVSSCIKSNRTDPKNRAALLMRKFLLALIGLGTIEENASVGAAPSHPAELYAKAEIEKLYIEAAEDPEIYMQHSFYDMVMNDYRGRMLRAFPSFYILFVDEGRDIGIWKLHDNFFNVSSIMDITVAKSRKNPVDTCNITLSNFYRNFITDDEGDPMTPEIQTTYQDAIDAIFSPRAYFLQEELRRQLKRPTERARMRAGARIHVRMGYGASATRLPIVFNGVIAECSSGDTVELVCQGDGVELMNPINMDDDAEELTNMDTASKIFVNLVRSSATPKAIMTGLLTTKGGFWRKNLSSLADTLDINVDAIINRNPFGLYHFGDPEYKDVFVNGESTQNIYEAVSTPQWGGVGTVSSLYGMQDAPEITFPLFGKTVWDALTICGSVSPDFIVSTAPFGFRSTIFHGHPRFYYAYEYLKDANSGMVFEKRKPFRQCHIYTAQSDIISNNISASEQNVRTCATGLFSITSIFGLNIQRKVGPMWADIEIYPEQQKSMIYDTRLTNKHDTLSALSLGIPAILQDGINLLKSSISNNKNGSYKIAWRATANALKNSVMDMYQGEVVVLGDPTVKPYDRMMIHDPVTGIGGTCLVKEVVTKMSVNTGFLSAITPDCVVTVDDPHEMAAQSILSAIGAPAITATAALTLGTAYAATRTAAVTKMFGGLTDVGKMASEKIVEYAGRAGVSSELANLMGFARAGLAVSAGASLIAFGGVLLVAKYVQTCFERWMENMQVLQVYPLRKYGMAWTAGLDGSRGLVYGSPTYNDPGTIKGLFVNLFGDHNSEEQSLAGQAVSSVIDIFFTSSTMKEVANRYKRGNGKDTGKADGIIRNTAMLSFGKDLPFARVLLTPRIKVSDISKTEYANTLEQMTIPITPQNAGFDATVLNDVNVIFKNESVKKYIDDRVFYVLHETAEITNDRKLEYFANIGGEVVKITGVRYKGGKDGDVLDLPMLRPDAIAVLEEILKQVMVNLPSVKSEDRSSHNPEDAIVLQSALRVGDVNSWEKTGFCFTLRGNGKSAEPLRVAIQKIVERSLNIVSTVEKTNPNNPIYAQEVDGLFKIFVSPAKTMNVPKKTA